MQPRLLKRNANRKVEHGAGEGAHLGGLGLVGCRGVAGQYHDVDINQIARDLFDERF